MLFRDRQSDRAVRFPECTVVVAHSGQELAPDCRPGGHSLSSGETLGVLLEPLDAEELGTNGFLDRIAERRTKWKRYAHRFSSGCRRGSRSGRSVPLPSFHLGVHALRVPRRTPKRFSGIGSLLMVRGNVGLMGAFERFFAPSLTNGHLCGNQQ